MFEPIKEFYKKNYTKLLIVPLFFTLFSFLIISSTFISTGEFVARDIELKGGISSTLDWEKETTPDIDLLESSLSSTLSSTVNVRTINEYGSDKTIAIAFETESEVGIEQFQSAIEAELISQGFDLEITPSSTMWPLPLARSRVARISIASGWPYQTRREYRAPAVTDCSSMF